MHIQVNYEPTATELANASLLFVEKKPFLLIVVGIINLLASLLIIIMILKVITQGLHPNEWLALIGGSLWLFARRPLNRWLLTRKMRKSPAIDKPVSIDITLNGIVWSGKGLQPGKMPWENIRYLLVAQNGFILPHNFSQFLWLPYRGFAFTEKIDEFEATLKEKKILLRRFPKWVC